jgi:hypothetical protein
LDGEPNTGTKTVIVIVDKIMLCGLCDKLRGIVSVYHACKKRNIPFKLYFDFPYDIRNYLAPNEYDWTIDKSELCFNKKYARHFFWLHTERFTSSLALNFFIRQNYRQIHIWTGARTTEHIFGTLFKELFKPVPELQTRIDYHLQKIGGHYISTSFRFGPLLYDAEHYEHTMEKAHVSPIARSGFPNLADNEKEVYMSACVTELAKLHEENPGYKILLATDEELFKNRVLNLNLDYVYIVEGNVHYLETRDVFDKETEIKTFLDFFMLSHSKKVVMMLYGKMFNGTFAYYAAKVNRAPYSIRRFG